jgi:hypothetical protein
VRSPKSDKLSKLKNCPRMPYGTRPVLQGYYFNLNHTTQAKAQGAGGVRPPD